MIKTAYELGRLIAVDDTISRVHCAHPGTFTVLTDQGAYLASEAALEKVLKEGGYTPSYGSSLWDAASMDALLPRVDSTNAVTGNVFSQRVNEFLRGYLEGAQDFGVFCQQLTAWSRQLDTYFHRQVNTLGTTVAFPKRSS